MFNLLNWLRRNHRLFSSRRPKPRSRTSWPRAPLTLLELEDRVTPTILHWTGAVSSNWSVAGNWEENQAPTSGAVLDFDTTTPGFAANTAAFAPVNDISGLTNIAVVVNDSSSSGDFTISGDSLGLATSTGAAIASTLSVGTAVTINNNLTLAANTTVDVGLGALTLGGIISGGFSLTEAGSPAGTLTLMGANIYTGGTILTSGTVSVDTNTSLGTGTLTLDGGTLADATSFLQLANPFVVNAPSAIGGGGFFQLNGNGTLNANLSGTNNGFLTLDGVLSGAGGFIEDGAFTGSTTLGGTAANTFTGGTTIYSGGVDLQKTPGVNALESPVTIVGSSGSLSLKASDQLNGNVAVSLGAGSTFSTGSFTDSVLSLTGLGALNTGSSTVNGLTVTGGGAQLLAAQVSGSGFLTYDGSGSLTLAGTSSSYTGTLSAAAGSLAVDADFSGATVELTGGNFGGTGAVKSITATGGTFDPATGGTVGTFNTASASVATSLSGATFQAQLAPQGVSDHLALGSNATLNLTGATLVLNATGATLADQYQIITSPTGGLSGTFNGLSDGSTITVAGVMLTIHYTANAVTLTNVGAPTATLHWTGAVSSDWSVTGNWEEATAPVSGDTLIFDSTTAGFAATTAAFAPVNDISGLTNLTIVVNDDSSAGDFSITGDSFGLATSTGPAIASTLSVGTAVTINNNLTLAANTTVDVGLGALTLGGIISGGFSLTEAGSPAGTLTLMGANIYTGGTVLTSGTVSVNTNTSLGTGTLTLDGGTLANATAFLALANPFVVNTPSTIGGGSFFELDGNGLLNANLRLTNSGFLTIKDVLSGTGGLIEDGFPGYTILAGTTANSFTGPTTIISGILQLNKTPGVDALVSNISLGGGAFPNLSWAASNQLNGNVSITSRGQLSTSGFSDTVANLNGTGSIATGSTTTAGLTVTGSGTNLVTGTISGSGLLTYNGTGSLTLAGASSSYTGKLTAEQGALIIDADFSGASSVTSTGGTLGGTGIVATLNSGGAGTIGPGGSGAVGILSTKGGSLTSTLAGDTLQVDVSDLGLSDQLVVGDSATLNLANATLNVNVLHSSAGSVYTIVSSATGGISGTFNGLTDGTKFVAGSREFVIHYTADAVTLTDVQTIALTPSTLPAGEMGLSYNQSITSTGGTGSVTLTVSNVTNTTGLMINGSGSGTITLTGPPTSAGMVTFTVTPSDSNGPQAGQTYTFTIYPAVVLSPPSLPPGEVGFSYNQSITSTGGDGTVDLTVSNTTNTTGLMINGSGTPTITITGNPMSSGTVTFTVTPSDAIGTGAGTVYTFTVNPAMALTPTSLPNGEVGLSYNQSITSTGGTAPVTLTVSNVTNTTGLMINGSGSGTITLTGPPTSAGSVTFTVTPSDAIGTGTAKTYSFTVGPAMVLTPSSLPPGEVGFAYNQSITSTGGTGTVDLTVSGVTNTTGLMISGSGTPTITLTGNPTSSGTVTFTVTPTDSIGTGAGTVYTFAVNPTMALTPTSLPNGKVGQTYNQSITSTGGTAPVTLTVSGVSNPTGLTISGSGTGTITLTGNPTASGTVSFTVTPSDSNGTGTPVSYSFVVGPAVFLTPASLPVAEVGLVYNQSITSYGGSGAVSLTVSGVTNTTGLTISGNGTGTISLTGTPTNSGTVTFTVTPTDAIGPGAGTVYSFVVRPKPLVAAGSAAGGSGTVTVYDPQSGTVLGQGNPFGAYSGGIKVATGDINGDGYSDLVIMGGPGSENGHILILSGKDFSVLADFTVGYPGEMNLAVADVEGTGKDDLILSTATSLDYVAVLSVSGTTHNVIAAYEVFGGLSTGVTLAAGDFFGNGKTEILAGTATQYGGAVVVNPLTGQRLATYVLPLSTNGVSVAAGDFYGTGRSDVALGALTPLPGVGPVVGVYDSETGQLVTGFVAFPGQPVGVRLSSTDVNSADREVLVVGFTGGLPVVGLFTDDPAANTFGVLGGFLVQGAGLLPNGLDVGGSI